MLEVLAEQRSWQPSVKHGLGVAFTLGGVRYLVQKVVSPMSQCPHRSSAMGKLHALKIPMLKSYPPPGPQNVPVFRDSAFKEGR